MATKKTINVKVSVSKIIAALETSMNSRVKQLADHDKATKEYKKADKEFMDSVADLFRAGKGKVVNVSTGSYRYNDTPNKYEITVEFPTSVKPPVAPDSIYDWQIKQEIEEIKNALSILKMTDEEIVSTNTYSGVAQYI